MGSYYDDKNLGEVLKKIRIESGFSLLDVEKITGVSDSYLSQIENGKVKSPPSVNTLYKLAQVYVISYQAMLELAGYIKENRWLKLKDFTLVGMMLSAYNELSDKGKEEVLNTLRKVWFRERKPRKD